MIEDGLEHWSPYAFGFDNAVRYSDPDGQFPPLLIAGAVGAAAGAIIGAGIEAGTQMYNNGGHVSDWHAVGGAALQGGVTGGMAGLTGGTSLLRSGAVGAVSNVAGGIARNVYDGKPVTVGSVAKDAAIGAAAGIAGHAAGKLAGAVINRVKGGAAAAEAEVSVGAKAATVEVDNGAKSSANAAKLNEHLSQLEKYGKAGSKELENGRIRYTGDISPASKPGTMVGRRVVREWNPSNGNKRTWMETVDGNGKTRIVRPETGGPKIHYQFDANGKFEKKW